MRIGRISELMEKATEFAASINAGHETTQAIVSKCNSLVNICDLINEDDVVKSIKIILPDFPTGRKVDTKYYEILKEAIIDSYLKRNELNNQLFKKKNISFNEWDCMDTTITLKKTKLLDKIIKLYSDNSETDMTKESIDKEFNEILNI